MPKYDFELCNTVDPLQNLGLERIDTAQNLDK